MDLSQSFTQELIESYEISKKELGYYPSRFVQMLSQKGGVETARAIIAKGDVSEGFEKLSASSRLDLSMEAAVIDPKYSVLFTDDEVNHCFALLCECGYFKI
ncbi:MAG: hypothetical protein VB078_04205 [Clostridiaceae bacterium]|nr:hypothetical protein [Clostridiaceae bacterium]